MTTHPEYIAYLKSQLDEACKQIAELRENNVVLTNKLRHYTAQFAPKNPNGGRKAREANNLLPTGGAR